MTPRYLASILCVGACGTEPEPVENWVVLESWLPSGSFADLHAIAGDELWVLTDAPELTVRHHIPQEEGEVLPSVELGGAPVAIWASGPDDVWVAGPALWRWDGADWAEVELAPLDGKRAELRDVWGSAPDDVWVTAQVDGETKSTALHFDGVTWSKNRDLRDLMKTYESLQEGCSNAPDDVWVRSLTDDGERSALFHWDGAVWSRPDARSRVADMQCDGETVWLIGKDTVDRSFLHFWASSWWEPRAVLEDESIELEHLWAHGKRGWITGRSMGRVEIWAFDERDVYPGLDGRPLPGHPGPSDPHSSLRAIWEPWTNETLAFGPDGLVYSYLWDLE